jgi:hypothetical protein
VHPGAPLATFPVQFVARNNEDLLVVVLGPFGQCLNGEGVWKLEFLLVSSCKRRFLGEVLLEHGASRDTARGDNLRLCLLQEGVELTTQVGDNRFLADLGQRSFDLRKRGVLQSAGLLSEFLLGYEFIGYAVSNAGLDLA